jgi:hypothetical protein
MYESNLCNGEDPSKTRIKRLITVPMTIPKTKTWAASGAPTETPAAYKAKQFPVAIRA